MTLFAVTNGVVTSYVYNSDGIRTQKVHYDETAEYVGTTKYTLDGNKIVAENRLGVNIYYTYDDKGSVMGMVYGGESYLFSKNVQGDIIGIYNESGTLVAKYEYNAFGEITAITDANGADVSSNASHIANVNPFRYRGYYYDTDTGFYYLQSRYYDPVVGRFLNADKLVDTSSVLGHNLFVYCRNNPTIMADTEGTFPFFAITAAIGAVVGAVVGGVKAAAEGKSVLKGAAVGAAVGGLVGAGLGAVASAALAGSVVATTAEVVAGASTLVTTVATGGAGAGAMYIANNLQQATNILAPTTQTSTAIQPYYPPNDGFSGEVQNITLNSGTLIQRTGELFGRFVAPAGTPEPMLSLPYDKIGQPTTILQVLQPVEVLAGRVAPWFGQMGGGIQYKLATPLDQLISEGAIKVFGG